MLPDTYSRAVYLREFAPRRRNSTGESPGARSITPLEEEENPYSGVPPLAAKGIRNEFAALNDKDLPQKIRDYFNGKIENCLPSTVDHKRVLIFDSNFECGNLERAHLVSCDEYNL